MVRIEMVAIMVPDTVQTLDLVNWSFKAVVIQQSVGSQHLVHKAMTSHQILPDDDLIDRPE